MLRCNIGSNNQISEQTNKKYLGSAEKLFVATKWLNVNNTQWSLRNWGIGIILNPQPRSGLNLDITYCFWTLFRVLVYRVFMSAVPIAIGITGGYWLRRFSIHIKSFQDLGLQKNNLMHRKRTFRFKKFAYKFLNTKLLYWLLIVLWFFSRPYLYWKMPNYLNKIRTHLNYMIIRNYSAHHYFYNCLIFCSTSRTENQILGYLFTSTPGCASLTGGYAHLATSWHKTLKSIRDYIS